MAEENNETYNATSSMDETLKHMHCVADKINQVVMSLGSRVRDHDRSKLCEPEQKIFDEFTPKLRGMTYGSEEYKECLKSMGPALKHHYENNRHHPEYHQNGINDMTLVDLIEMLMDWWAATERHADGDIQKSIEHNASRFSISPQLVEILKNTIKYI